MNFSGRPHVTTRDRHGFALHRPPPMPDRNPIENGELQLHLLVLRCQAGDERAFAQLMSRFERRTLEYVRGLLGDPFLADDVHQEVWLAVYLGIRSLTNPRAFRTWLFRTTRHRTLDFIRHRKRESDFFDDAALDDLESTAAVHLAVGDAAGLDVAPGLGSLDADALAAVMAGLAPAQREVLLLRYQDDLSYAEIALVIGRSVGTVRSRLHYAKQRLETALEQFNGGTHS
jgi:RNA polymerase sigma-70 factor, ECF subfamily